MNVLFQIPPRIKKKNGLFGTAKTVDIVYAVAFALAGLIIMFLTGSWIGAFIMISMIGFAYLFFIMPDKYGENLRIKYARARKFKRQQKRFLYYRTFNQPIFLKQDNKNDSV